MKSDAIKAENVPRDTLKQIQTKAKQQFGLSSVSARPLELYRKLVWIAKQQHITEIDTWLEQLAHQPWTDAIREQVIPAFTVGETYFRRDPNASLWLRNEFFPKLFAKRQAQKNLRIDCWSAGCCTGEEAYGLLFLANELKPAEITLNIVATDLNRDFLRQAKAGRYRQGSFRSPEPDFQERYFTEDGNDWVVVEKWRNRIQFEPLNLIQCEPPRGHHPFDLILCRNVLMYFSQDDACNIIHMYVRHLRDDGILLLGAVDASLAASAGYDGFWAGDNYAVRGGSQPHQPRQSLTEALTDDWHQPPTPAAPKKVVVRPLSRATEQALAKPAPQTQRQITSAPPKIKPSTATAAQLQGQLENPQLSRADKAQLCIQLALTMQAHNRLEEATNWLSEATSIYPLCVRAHVLLGQHYLFNQQHQLAADALQRALYLEPNSVAGNFYFGQVCQHLGRSQVAIKSLQHCLKQLQGLADAHIVEDTGELSVGHLKKLAEQLIHSGVTYAD